MTGSTVGHYVIREKLGGGGMGEVYRAQDSKLDREVAIKVLPASFADDAERTARFLREAKILAAMNHPNIAAVYGIEQDGRAAYLVMELVPGETMAARLARGPLPKREALVLCGQIAGALDAAHERGIVHRDLKPANIMVTPDGRVKLLDFGLAKSSQSGPNLNAETRTLTEVTSAGTVLGTVAYMSPEQARGLEVDKRADIWSFGCVLYEALQGRRLFSGASAADVISAIVGKDPPIEDLPEGTPARVRALIERCLRHDLTRRLRSMAAAEIELEEALQEWPAAAAVTAPPPAKPWLWILCGMLIAAAGFGAWLWMHPAPAAENIQFQRLTDMVGMEEWPALSPDGKAVAFVAQSAGRRQIWVRLMASGGPVQITHDDADHDLPRWSADSSSLIYYSPSDNVAELGTLYEVPSLGGTPRRIAAALGGADVSHDGRRIAFFLVSSGKFQLMVAARDGSGPAPLAGIPDNFYYSTPRWSPNDQSIAFVRQSYLQFDKRVLVASVTGGELREVTRSNDMQGIAWLPDGSGLVYSSSLGSTVLYPPVFNLRRVGLDGKNDQQLTFGEGSLTQPDASISGKIVASRVRGSSNIWRIPATGTPAENTRNAVRVSIQTGSAQVPSPNPDGKLLAYLSDSGGHGNIWVMGVDGSDPRQITLERDPAVSIGLPHWSPVSNQIVFIRADAKATAEWIVNLDGSGLRSLAPQAATAHWSHDGKWVYFARDKEGESCLCKTSLESGTTVEIRCGGAVAPAISRNSTLYWARRTRKEAQTWDYEIVKAAPEDGTPQRLGRINRGRVPYDPLLMDFDLSPDEKWLVMPLTDRGTTNVWVLPTAGGAFQKITDFGDRPVLITRYVSWAPDGKSLFVPVAEIDADVVSLDGLIRK